MTGLSEAVRQRGTQSFEFKRWNRKKTLELLQQYLWNAALGKPIDRCRVLVEIGRAKKDTAWLEVTEAMLQLAREGSEVFVSKAMQRFPERFPVHLRVCVREAEVRGQLDGIIPVLENVLRVEVQLSGKILGPLQRILVIFVLSQVVLVGVCATQLGSILEQIEGKDMTQFGFFGSQAAVVSFIYHWPWLWMLLVAGCVVGGRWVLAQPWVQAKLETAAAHLSVFAVLLELRWFSFLGSLQVLLRSGALLGESLEHSSATAGSYLGAALAGIGRHMQVEGNSVRSFLRRKLCVERIQPEIRAFLSALEAMPPETRLMALEIRRQALATQVIERAATTAVVFEVLGYLPIAATVVFLEAFIIQFSVVLPKLQ